MVDHLSGLNSKQKEAATHMEGPLLIVAGAGAGKTKTITHRILNLIKNGVAPEKILAVTFTNKAAKEMKERVYHLLNSEGQNVLEKSLSRFDLDSEKMPFVSTFHSLGVYIIKENAKILGLTRHFTILDESDSTALIKEATKEMGLDPKQYDPKKIGNIISREKGKFTHLVDYKERASDYLSKIVAQVWNLYERKKAKENSLDFDDLLLKATKLLKENEQIRKIYQKKWDYIHVDEYQDTNEVQYLMSRLLSENNKNICVVGDADQNIYSWRGANLKNILSFEKDYGKDVKIILLEENYRSTKNIIAAGNAVMQPALAKTDKTLWTANAEGVKLIVTETIDEISEAQFVVDEILQSLSAHTSSEPLYWSADDKPMTQNWTVEQLQYLQRFAVLYRTNAQSRVLEEAFLRAGIPYQLIGGIRFYERQEVKDVLAYLRLIINPFDVISFERALTTPRRGIGEDTVSKIMLLARDTKISLLERCQNPENLGLPTSKQGILKAWAKLIQEFTHAAATLSVADLIDLVIDKSGIKEELNDGSPEGVVRLENIEELKSVALERGGNPGLDELTKFLEEVALYQDHDRYNSQGGGVTLMTLHSAKGLEFDVVFIVGMEEGLFPHMNSLDDKKELDEERRLAYVGITRAREKVYLIYLNQGLK